jgi:hypothetical protein
MERGNALIIAILLFMRLLGFLAIIIFSAWLIRIGHPGYLWLSVLFLLCADTSINIKSSDEIKNRGGG